ncbi:hypothetical protein [Streptomyces lydicus]|uniref:hypothetical protein n=1 Tax=Streptomyces lydicus TaxID=47763 RepID=UPI0036EE8B3F
MTISTQNSWPEGVIARYLTVGGATVDIEYASVSGVITASCYGCPWQRRTDTQGLRTDTPEEEQERVDDWMPTARKKAQGHAETCRAMPRPAGE